MDSHSKSLFSRQIGAIGKNSMEKLMNTNILIIGSNSIAIEFVKCVSLLGIKKIVFVSVKNSIVKKNNITKYYHTVDDGKNKIANIVDLVKVLNPCVDCIEKVLTLNENIVMQIEKHIKIENINITVYTDILPGLELQKLEAICIANDSKFVCGFNYGLEGYVFSNFGKHSIDDADGEITQITFVENFNTDDIKIYLIVEKLQNTLVSKYGKLMNNKQEKIYVKVLECQFESITIEKTDKIIEFLENNKSNNIRFVETKTILNVSYKNIDKYLENPNHRIMTLNSSFTITDNSIKSKNDFISNIQKAVSCIDFYKKIANYNEFSILGSIIGGILAHEVIKTTGKYIPLDQDIYFDYRDLNPKHSESALYEKQKNVLDKSLLKKLSELSIFMVGCGALGCEISKNLGLLDVSTKSKGLLTITDMDTIELSNLNRQFLFRNDDIGKHKSDTVKKRLSDYFPGMNVKSFNSEVGKNTENMFNAGFWKNNDIVINALDNIEARQYVDSRCVLYERPLFESGTLGSKCNTQTIIPHKTATYSEIVDIDDKSIPMCTIKNFPNKLEHCVEWSIEVFDKIVTQPLVDLNSIINDRKVYLLKLSNINDSLKLERYSILFFYIELYSDKGFTSFIKFCHKIYDMFFKNPIKDVLHSFPDTLTDSYGNKFWSGKKIKPTLYSFKDIELCANLVSELYIILKNVLSLKEWDDNIYKEYFGSEFNELDGNYACNKIIVNEDKDEITVHNEDSIKNAEIMYNKISKILFKNKHKVSILKYDKDDDNLLSLMTSITNIRAKIYSISLGDSQEIKMISGRIIPALSTTTTIISGFVLIEILKYLCGKESSDTNLNIGTNNYIIFDSQKPDITYNNMMSKVYGMKIKTVPEHFNTWTRLRISIRKDHCLSIDNLITILKNDYNIDPNMLNIDKYVIYNSCKKSNKDMQLCDIYKKLEKPLSEYLEINICAFSDDGMPILSPSIILTY